MSKRLPAEKKTLLHFITATLCWKIGILVLAI